MKDLKPWYASKSIWGSLIAIIAVAGSALGLNIDQQLQTQLTEAALQIVAVAASLFAVFGRLSAKSIIE